MELLLNTLKVSLIVGCAVLLLILLKPVLRRRYHAKWKYYVWLALALALLLPLAPRSDVWMSAVGEAAPIQIEVPAVVPFERGRGAPAAQDAAAAQTPPGGTAVHADTGAASAARQEDPEPAAAETAEPVPVETILTWIWAAGVVLFALYHLVGTAVFCRRSLRWSRPSERAFVQEAMDETLRELGIRRKVELWVSSAIDTPMMVGLIHPQLLLPTENYSVQELRFILKHELTHYKRHDLWYKLALLAANAVHWFNPLAYLLVREANVDMELTCDDAVVAGADLATRRAYSETLLAAIHKQKGFQAAALSTHFYGGAETMKARFRNILGTGKRKRGVVALCVVLLLTITAGCIIGFTSQRTVELDAGELADWEEKLNSLEWNGFVTHMYSDVKYLSLEELLYNGAGIDHEMSEEELAAYLDAIGGENMAIDVDAISAQDLADYLQEYTGLTIEDFAAPLEWTYLETYDAYYHMHGDTNFQQVEVVSGTKTGDTVALEISAPGSWDSGMVADTGAAWVNGTLTVTDGKVVSYTNDLYTAVEAMALVGLRDLEDSYAEDLPVVRSWMEVPRIWDASGGELGDYYQWRVVYHLLPETTKGLAEGVKAWLDSSGRMNAEAAYIVRLEEDGTVTQLESVSSTAMVDPMEYSYLDLSFGEYCRYHYDYGLELAGRQLGWPVADNRLTVSIQNGGDQWTQSVADVVKGWLMSYGDDLERYEEVYMGIPRTSDAADQDLVLRVWTTEGRELLLLLDHVIMDYGIGDWADTISYWEVAGEKLESGAALPTERVGQDSRRSTIMVEGMTEEVPCFLYSAGGDYGIYTWSIYIPYEQWSCNYLANRWCPNQDDMTTYIEVREHDAAYTAETFFDSYEQQFEEVWINEAVYGTGEPDTVTVAWALGYQSAGGGRYTESYLFTGQGRVFEVLWTYAAEAAEGWGARMRWTADTFTIIGDTQAYITGELTQVKPGEAGEKLVVTQESGELAGTYLVLPNDNAFQLEGYALGELQASLLRDFVPGAFGEAEIVSITQAATYSGAEIFGGASQDTVEVFLVDWGAQAMDTSLFTPVGGMRDDGNGFWRFGMAEYLVLVHNGEYVTETALMRTEIPPDGPGFLADVQRLLTNGGSAVTHWESHWALFYDRTTEEIYSVSTQPNMVSNE